MDNPSSIADDEDVILARTSSGEIKVFRFVREADQPPERKPVASPIGMVPMYSKLCVSTQQMVLVCLDPSSNTFVRLLFNGDEFKRVHGCDCSNCFLIPFRNRLPSDWHNLPYEKYHVDSHKRPLLCVSMSWNEERTSAQLTHFVNHEGRVGKYDWSQRHKCWKLRCKLDKLQFKKMSIDLKKLPKSEIPKLLLHDTLPCLHTGGRIFFATTSRDDAVEQYVFNQVEAKFERVRCRKCIFPVKRATDEAGRALEAEESRKRWERLGFVADDDGTVCYEDCEERAAVSEAMEELRKDPKIRRHNVFVDKPRSQFLSLLNEEELIDESIYWLADTMVQDICPFRIGRDPKDYRFGKFYAIRSEELNETRDLNKVRRDQLGIKYETEYDSASDNEGAEEMGSLLKCLGLHDKLEEGFEEQRKNMALLNSLLYLKQLSTEPNAPGSSQTKFDAMWKKYVGDQSTLEPGQSLENSIKEVVQKINDMEFVFPTPEEREANFLRRVAAEKERQAKKAAKAAKKERAAKKKEEAKELRAVEKLLKLPSSLSRMLGGGKEPKKTQPAEPRKMSKGLSREIRRMRRDIGLEPSTSAAGDPESDSEDDDDVAV